MKPAVSAAAGSALALTLLAGCSAAASTNTAAPLPGKHPASTSPALPSPAATSATASASPGGLSAGDQRVLAANKALGDALFALSSKSAKMDADRSMATQRQAMAAALSQARSALTSQRQSASCSSVFAYQSSVSAAQQRVLGARSALLGISAKVRADLQEVNAAKAVVQTRLTALQEAVKAEPTPPATPAADQVQAALTGEAQQEATVLAGVTAGEQQAAQSVSTMVKLRAQAAKVSARLC